MRDYQAIAGTHAMAIHPRVRSSAYMRRLAAAASHIQIRNKAGSDVTRLQPASDLPGEIFRHSSRYFDSVVNLDFIASFIADLVDVGERHGIPVNLHHVLRGDQKGSNQAISRHHFGAAVDVSFSDRQSLREVWEMVRLAKQRGYVLREGDIVRAFGSLQRFVDAPYSAQVAMGVYRTPGRGYFKHFGFELIDTLPNILTQL